ncbi:uncharacterized protein UV8b_02537 [Ustilaginoidea virens]|uniref:Uncharacterized protein n=1 Tax=Ustilaginoidea virens TaxID=1159556 RepID=A0A063BS17_USTVR|nr:uncharacterized protein UV8b_02537 [Ustilaginoidea virens]QUC18296.1 hypothetical protein UV8b_02537 [Ustilaginoidea virens]GAO16136.1 hypothetical protein UVI_02040310 [Ustilaginoidea virens]
MRRTAEPPRGASYSSRAAAPSATKPSEQLGKQTSVTQRPRPSRSELASYLQGLKDLQRSASGPGHHKSRDFTVRFFEQDEHKQRELKDDEAFQGSLRELDGSDFKDALRDIQASLGSREEQDAFQAVLREVGGDMNNVSSARDMEKMMQRFESYTKSIDAEIETAGSSLPRDVLRELRRDLRDLPLSDDGLRPRHPAPQIPAAPWTLNQRKKISVLNLELARAFRNHGRRDAGFSKKTVSAVFRAYHAARFALVRNSDVIPLNVWELLWNVLSADESVNVNRLAHLSLLSRDMSAARVTLSPSQQLLTIEAMFVEGWQAKAVESWKRCLSTLGDDKSGTFQDYWELGARIFCRTGDMDQAERAVDRLLSKGTDPRILMPVIRTFSAQGTPESQERACDAYRRMRSLLGKKMKLSDYDQVVAYFLTSHQMENALCAFVDMMTDGKVDLKKQKYMPSVIANKFFLGKWLKRLIGAGDLDGAYSVVEYMRARGVHASPIHLNGLIGAWLRSGGADDLARADTLAWSMIASRIRFVGSRASPPAPAAGGSGGSSGSSGDAPWPPATLETFSLLAENYQLRHRPARLEALWDACHDAGISPNAFMMNQLMESSLQAGRPEEALSLYRALVAERGVAPDPYTFSVLWKTLAINRLHVIPPESSAAETDAARELFRETVAFAPVFEPHGMDGQLGRKILHTFRRLQDPAGFLVALTALRRVLRFSPPEMLVLELVLGTTKLSCDSPAQRRRLIVAKRTLDGELSARCGGGAEDLDGHKRQDALYEYLQDRYRPRGELEKTHEAVLMQVAKQMGVGEIVAREQEGKRAVC